MSRINDIKGEKVHTRWQNSLIYIGICAIFICCTTPDAMANGGVSCKPGYYLSQCGSTVIGTNMLKGFIGDNDIDYYDYQDPANNLVNLRILFERDYSNPNIIYRDKDNVQHIVNRDEYELRREKILLYECNPNEKEIICLPCPDGGKVPGNVTMGGVHNSISEWSTPIFAHCRKDKLNDTTGTYKYVTDTGAATYCYYNTDIPGTTIYYSAPTTGNNSGGNAD